MARSTWPIRVLVPAVTCSFLFASPAAALAAAPSARTQAVTMNAVQIAGKTFPLSGTNVYRAFDSLVLYTRAAGTVTTTNEYGAEAVVVNGVVTALRDRQSSHAGGTAIPTGGVVLSGHGTARDWLLANARVGAAVSLPGATAGTSTAVRIGTASRAVAGTNIERAANALVIYTSAAGSLTPTNIYGAEAVVVNGVITAVRDRQSTGAGATSVPGNGVVLSGHGSARDWLLTHAKVGSAVLLPGRVPTATPAPAPVPAPAPPVLAPAPVPPVVVPPVVVPPVAVPPAPAPAVPAAPAPAPAPANAVVIGAASRTLAGVNIERATDQLVLYTGTQTPTNIYGTEAVVVGGKIVSVLDRYPTAAGATSIPDGGAVLSGHGTSSAWLLENAHVGSAVTLPVTVPSPSSSVPVPAPAPTAPPTQAPAPNPPPTQAGTTATPPMAYPAKAVAIYHMMWSNSGSPRLSSTPANVNVVNLSFAQGNVPSLTGWGSQSEASFIADAKALRARGVRIVVSIGGAGGHINVADRASFVSGIMAINDKLPLDGIDWDIEGAAMGAADVVAVSATLRQRRGNAFAITMAPNGSNIGEYLEVAKQLHARGLLDMIGQQFYDAVVSPAAARWATERIINAGIPQSKISVGMMVGDAAQYWTVEECLTAVAHIRALYPNIKSGYLWEAGRAGSADWANRVGGMLLNS